MLKVSFHLGTQLDNEVLKLLVAGRNSAVDVNTDFFEKFLVLRCQRTDLK